MPPRPLSAIFDEPLPPTVQRPSTTPPEVSNDRSQLTSAEQAWSAHQDYFESNGFILRPRLRSDWKPSWLGTNDDPSKYEDSIRITALETIDATRAFDGVQVVLKAIYNRPTNAQTSFEQPNELVVLKHLHTSSTGHACNHIVPLLGSIPMPNAIEGRFAVFPLLRMHDDPPFSNVGEVVEFMGQVLRGLAFMHEQNVAHRDIKPSNIMMAGEALYDEPFHPVAQSLSLDAKTILRPRLRHELDSQRCQDGEPAVRYYFVNFSQASHLPPAITEDGRTKSRFLRPNRGQLGRFPEAMLTVGHDPFKADVYCMGKYVIDDLIRRHLVLAPFISLARFMTKHDPRARPTATEALTQFETIRRSLDAKRLNLPLDFKGYQLRYVPLASPRRAISSIHLPTRIHHSHTSWSSTESARTLVAEIPSPIKEALKGHEPVTRTKSSPEVAIPEKKKSRRWGILRAALKAITR